ncbi:daunorubicin resistance protein DrrA family ABC transporter ATP-binding protein [soil metagenome]
MENNTDYAIVAKDLRKSYGKTEVLKGVNLSIERGKMLALLGPNGAGKTTTVRILSTLLSFEGGSATVEGFDVIKQADEVREVIGLTGQYAAVDEYLTGMQNLVMMGRLYHLSKANATTRAHQLLEQFDLVDASARMVKTYSGGMRRRLDLAISLIATPPIIFLDEPTTGLDPRSRLAMWDVIRKLMDSGATILLTTQYLEEADQLADRIAVIDHGKVIAEGTANELKKKVGTDRAQLTFATADELTAAQKLLKAKTHVDEAKLELSFSVDKVASLTEALNQLESAKIAIASIAIHKPTLDDVFLQLTGKPAEDAEEQPKKKSAKKN